ncbi:uncharacterized protein LOC119303993 isoform X2 [Triticum dicoccoides]|uniref:uncharacterized protein LOC119303993 isoform X2 n=2 Tax=Triticum dicoccoides TaxID=85692 RepID=UPI00188E3B6C|nr:uncharacterized protein LOC119303993 isoform X2 [Triticum dicoccoides]
MALDERNASQRARRQSLTIDERQEINARRRARRQSLPPEERQALLAQRNASYASKRDALCRDSVALQCPTGSLMGHPSSSSYVFSHPGTLAQTSATIQVDNPSSPHDGFVYSDSPIESFVADDDDSHMSEEQDDEYFAFAGRGDDEDLVDAFTTDTIVPDLYDRVYHNIPVSTHMLTPKPDCNHCGAKRFQYETSGFCCRSRKINLAHSEPPLELQMLYTSSDPNAVHFRENIRYFNGHFSFTTLGVSLDNKYTNMSSGVYTFRAHGQIYHNVFSFGPTQDGPKHLELYFYDDDPSLQHRFRRSPNLDRDVIRKLVDILKDNPYSETFRNLGGVDDLEEYRIELNTDMRLDQRRYNLPISSEVAAIWVEGNELCKHFDRSIVLFGNDNKRYSIQPYYG